MVVHVPEAAPAVDDWRRRHTGDALLGVPAHITLLYPFVSPERLGEQVEAKLGALLARFPSFEFALARTARFPTVLYLAPEPAEPFARLTEAIAAEWPEHPPYEGEFDTVVPHLTVSCSEDQTLLDEISAAVEPELPIHSRASEALLLVEDEDGSWRERRRLPFAEAA